jgi:nucleotide-binding universal stress UspA family protein
VTYERTRQLMEILLCTDGSRNALAAVTLGGRLAAALDAHTTLLSAGLRSNRVHQAMDEAVSVLTPFRINPDTVVSVGRAADEFVAQAKRAAYDLVVVGYRRRRAVEKAVVGSLATRVAQQAKTSVLIVRRGRPDIRRILVGLGGNGFTDELARWAMVIAAAVGAHVTLLHVESAPPLMYAGFEEVHQTLAEFLATGTPGADALRQAAAVLRQAEVQAEIKMAHGVTDREMLRTAQEGDFDLLIVGSSWAGPSLSRVVLPNVTREILLQTTRPVLVVYPSHERGPHLPGEGDQS